MLFKVIIVDYENYAKHIKTSRGQNVGFMPIFQTLKQSQSV
jgi:hypothetical protein